MKDQELQNRLGAFVERVTMQMEGFGLPHYVAKTFSWLLVCDPPEQSAEDLMELTGASKGSMSTATRMLQQMHMIDKVRPSGERKYYWRIRSGMWVDLLKIRLSILEQFSKIADEGLELLGEEPAGRSARLKEMKDLYDFMSIEFPSVLDKWEKKPKESSDG